MALNSSNAKSKKSKNEFEDLIESQNLIAEVGATSRLISKSEIKLMAKRTEIEDVLKEYQLSEESINDLEKEKVKVDLLLETLSRTSEYIDSIKKSQVGMTGGMSIMAYENQCGSCVYFESNGDSKGYCSYIRSYYYPGDKTCVHYSKGNSGCYITTIVCDILELPDDCGLLETLRNFRSNVLQKEPKYKKVLYEYDVVGPQIAKCLMEDYIEKEDKEMANGLLNCFILPTVDRIKEGRNTEAVKIYTQLTEVLIDTYGIERVKEVPNDYDYTKGGHGVKKLGTIGGNLYE